MLSQLAVFKDIIPGYRIRPLSDKEKTEKVSQAVSRSREWEQGLVGVYQTYLRALDAELKGQSQFWIMQTLVINWTAGKTELADVGLSCMCTLLIEVTHFNFRSNLLASIIARLSKKSWDQVSVTMRRFNRMLTSSRDQNSV
jgi:nucleolar complex protein 3